VFEVISELWNCSEFNPVAPPSDCHFDFQVATDCSYNLVKSLAPATPEKVEDIFVSMRAHLLRIITRWEQSGQGEGGRENEDAEEPDQDDAASFATSIATQPAVDGNSPDKAIGSLLGRPARALQSRAAFLNGRPSYLLYFWEIADQHQLLQSSLQRLNNGTGASDASSAPSANSMSNSNRRRRSHDSSENNQHEEQASLAPLVESIKELAECQRELVFDRREDRRHELEIEQQRRSSERSAQSSDRRFRRRAELSDLARKYRKLNAELPNDQTSRRLSEFYLNEGRQIEEEIRLLDRNDDNS
jgi:hypothetical protein